MRFPLPRSRPPALCLPAARTGRTTIELLASSDALGCRFEAEGRVLAEGSLAEAETMLAKAARRWKGRSVTVLGGEEVPFKCFGLEMFVLQQAGAEAGFIGELPPDTH